MQAMQAPTNIKQLVNRRMLRTFLGLLIQDTNGNVRGGWWGVDSGFTRELSLTTTSMHPVASSRTGALPMGIYDAGRCKHLGRQL